MKCVIQRVSRASVRVGGSTVSSIGAGLLVLAAVEKGDSEEASGAAASKISELRIFGDENGKMNLALGDIGGSVLAVSQFTLAGSIDRGRRPSFDGAEEPERASRIFETFVDAIRARGIHIETGVFGEMMEVELVNDGPVTFVLET
jgi:D-tyrosyl-tRNA(Tyr) deacylase